MSPLTFFAGTYTEPADHVQNAHGLGILTCELDLSDGRIKQRSFAGGILNPTYLKRPSSSNHLYVASENCVGLSDVYLYQISENGELSKLQQAPTNGVATCHVEVVGNRLFAASYGSGNLSVHATDDPTLPQIQLMQYQGSGPNTNRQEAAHAHQAMPSSDGNWLYICDLGADTIWCHDLHKAVLDEPKATKLPAGSGPRHLVFHPNKPFVYIACELTADLIVCRYEPLNGDLQIVQKINSLPPSFEGMPSAAAVRIHPTGQAVYLSNRQCNRLVTFAVAENGTVKLAKDVPSGGSEPRDFQITPDGRFALIANQDSDNISVYQLDPQSGLPISDIIEVFECATPVCIEF